MADVVCCSGCVCDAASGEKTTISNSADLKEMEEGVNRLDVGAKTDDVTSSSSGKDRETSGRSVGNRFVDPSTISPPSSLAELISRLHEIFAHDEICVEYVQELMTSCQSNPSEWKKFALFDKYKYTRNLVDEGNGKFNLMILCWNEAQGSSIHSHADSHCFLKVLDGELKEELYDWPDHATPSSSSSSDRCSRTGEGVDEAVMKKRKEMRFSTNDCTYINDSIGLHRVENVSHINKTVTLHLYSPPFQACQCFDQRSGHATTAKMTFWSKYGKRTPYGKYPEKMEQPVEDN